MNKINTLLKSLNPPWLWILLVMLSGNSWAQSDPWTSIAPSNTPKWVGHPVQINNKMYVFSGFDNASVQTTGKNEVYDPLTNQWTYLVAMPNPVTHAGATVDGDQVYISGGFLGTNAATNLVQIYNTTSNTWRQGPPLPTASSSHALVRVGRHLHSFGGLKTDRKTDTGLHYVLDLDTPAAGWVMAAPLPLPRNHIASVHLAGRIYVLGGQQGHDGPTLEVPYAHVYDPVTDTWTRLKDLPYARSHSETATFVTDGKITLLGGVSTGETILNTVTTYDPASDTWTEQAPLPAKLFGPSADVIGNELIVANGSLDGRTNPQTSAYKRAVTRSPQYQIGFAPSQVKLVAAAGTSVSRQTVLWSLSGSPAYAIAGSLPSWLTLSPAEGTLDLSGGTQVNITANTAGLSPGTYRAVLQAQAAGYPDAGLTIELEVAATLPGILYLYGSNPPAIHDMKLSDTGPLGLSLFRRALQESGFTLAEALDAQVTLDAATLAPYKVLILGSNNRRFSAAEQLAVAAWVQAGGGLVAWTDAAFGWADGGTNSIAGAVSDNDLTQQFGMQFLHDNGAAAFTLNQWAGNHYINLFNKDRGLTIEAEGASPIRTTAPATILAYLPAAANRLNSLDGAITAADAAMSVARVGQGRVVGLFDRNAFWNAGDGTWLSRVDNKTFAQRMLLWASGVDDTEGPTPPQLVAPLADVTVQKNSAATQLDLTRSFSDNGGAANLAFTVVSATNPQVVSAAIQNNMLALSYSPNATGQADITIRATDAGGLAVEDRFQVTVVDTIIVPAAQELVSFTLFNADNDQEIKTLVAGETLNLATLPTRNLNIRANTKPVIVGSVKMALTGAQVKNVIETGTPYALFGDNAGNYYGWVPPLGTYSLVGTPYTSGGGGGTAGKVLTVAFSVIDQADTSNVLPVANAGTDKTIVLPVSSISLTGTGTDADGTISTYTWSQVSGPAPASFSSTAVNSPTVDNLVAGTYLFSMVVTDNQNGLSTPDQVTVTVDPAPAPEPEPVALAPVAFRINAGGSQVVNSVGTFAADGYYTGGYVFTTAKAIANTLDDAMYQTERSSTTNNGSFSYAFPLSNGTYKVVLHFADLYWSGPGKRVFDVKAENVLVLDNYDIVKKVGVNFTATTENITVNVADGTLDLLFSALASEGGVDRPKVSAIEILPLTGGNQLPAAQAGMDQVLTLPGSSITLAGTGSDADGTITAYSWTKQSGPAATLAGANTGSLTASGLVAGSYVFRLTVTDNGGATAFDEVTVTVNNAPAAGQQLVSFTLVNAANEQDIRTLVSGETINLADLPTNNLNIRANTNPGLVGSVKLSLSGAQAKNVTESGAPYALFGDSNGNYYSWVPAVGLYTLVGTPYTGSGASGTAGTPLTVTFQVINQAAAARMAVPAAPETRSNAGVMTYPNPVTEGRFQVALPRPVEGQVAYELTTITGVRVAKGNLQLSRPQSILDLNFTREMQASGMYYLKLEGSEMKYQIRVVRQ